MTVAASTGIPSTVPLMKLLLPVLLLFIMMPLIGRRNPAPHYETETAPNQSDAACAVKTGVALSEYS